MTTFQKEVASYFGSLRKDLQSVNQSRFDDKFNQLENAVQSTNMVCQASSAHLLQIHDKIANASSSSSSSSSSNSSSTPVITREVIELGGLEQFVDLKNGFEVMGAQMKLMRETVDKLAAELLAVERDDDAVDEELGKRNLTDAELMKDREAGGTLTREVARKKGT